MKKIIALLSKAQSRLSASIEETTKTAHALMQMGFVFGSRKKTAQYSPSVVERAVQQHFRSEGLQNPPDVDWHQVFFGIMKGLAIRNKWEKWYEEELASAVFGDLLMGENIDTSYQWSHGNLATIVRRFQEAGKDADDIRNLMMKRVKQVAIDRHNKWQRKGIPFDHSDNNQRDEDYQGIALDLLNFSPLSREQASSWMSMAERNPEIKKFLKLINQQVQRSGNEAFMQIWKAMKENPGFESRSDLAREEITFFSREDGRTKKMPLYEALGQDEPRKIYYQFGKFQQFLASLKPAAMKLLAS